MKKNEILLKLTSGFSIIITVVLIIIKAIAWLITGSLVILSSLVDSGLDLMTALVNFFAIKYSLKPNDENHKFGHGAIEDIACLLQAGFISGSAVFILFQSVRNLMLKEKLRCDKIGIIIMMISLGLKISLIIVQKYTVKKTNSSIIKAESLNYLADVVMNLSVTASLIIIEITGFYYIDSVMAIVIALLILRSAYSIGRKAFDNIMCKELSSEIREKIINIIYNSEGISGYHDLKTRMSGNKSFVQVHLEIDKKLALESSHEITKKIDKKIEKLLGECEVIIHQDPVWFLYWYLLFIK